MVLVKRLDNHRWWIFVALVLPWIAWRFLAIDAPLSTDRDASNILYAWPDFPWDGEPEGRHPPGFLWLLFFTLQLGYPLVGTEHVEALGRLWPVLSYVGIAALVFHQSCRLAGTWTAGLASGLLVAWSPALIRESHGVSDTLPFVFGALLAMDLALKQIGSPSNRREVGLILVLLAIMYTYYLAPLVVAAVVGCLVWRRSMVDPWSWLVGGILSIPAWVGLGRVLLSDRERRGTFVEAGLQSSFADDPWFASSGLELLFDVFTLLGIHFNAAAAVVLCAAVGAGWCWGRNRGRELVVMTAGVCAVMLVVAMTMTGAAFLRGSYFLFLIPVACVFAGCAVVSSRVVGGLAAALIAFSVTSNAQILGFGPAELVRVSTPGQRLDALLEQAPSGVVVVELEAMVPLAVFHLGDPHDMWASCRNMDHPTQPSDFQRECGDPPELIALGQLQDLGTLQGQQKMVTRFDAITMSALFVRDGNWTANPLLMERVETRCTELGSIDSMTLYDCPGR